MIKSVVSKNQAKSEKPFPKLMVVKNGTSGGTIVFFQKNKCGIVIHGEGYYKNSAGCFSRDWYMPEFTDFHGTVTLSNE